VKDSGALMLRALWRNLRVIRFIYARLRVRARASCSRARTCVRARACKRVRVRAVVDVRARACVWACVREHASARAHVLVGVFGRLGLVFNTCARVNPRRFMHARARAWFAFSVIATLHVRLSRVRICARACVFARASEFLVALLVGGSAGRF
jgi:hypothetical protein